jgi:mannose-1-phosphate guanylyltransferase
MCPGKVVARLSRDFLTEGLAMRDPAGQWAIILAGGDGLRLRPLTRLITGDDRPKQFCPLLGGETLLARVRRRVGLAIGPDRTVLVLTRQHEPFYAPLLAGTSPGPLVVQPQNRGTAPAILYALLEIAGVDPLATVAILPSDHYVSDDVAFMAHVRAAGDAVERRPELVVLLGIEPDAPEPEYGWIEPGEPLPLAGLRRVRRFWEKPAPPLARRLMAAGALWSSFVIVARIPALLAGLRAALPDLEVAFGSLRATLGTGDEILAAEDVYTRIPPADFSRSVLARNSANLAVRPVHDVRWSDLGLPERVVATLAGLAAEHPGAGRPAAASA